MHREQPIQSIIDNFKTPGRFSDNSDGQLALRLGNYPDWVIWEAHIEWFMANEPDGEIGMLDFVDEDLIDNPPEYWKIE